MLAELLGTLGSEVTVVHDGAEAIRRAEEFRPEVLLLDIGMPGFDGYEVCRRIRRAPWSAGMKIVALTGWGHEEDRRRSAAAGFDRHLVKPVAPEQLVEILRQLALS
jgi:CheY-like chemotaxis protein